MWRRMNRPQHCPPWRPGRAVRRRELQCCAQRLHRGQWVATRASSPETLASSRGFPCWSAQNACWETEYDGVHVRGATPRRSCSFVIRPFFGVLARRPSRPRWMMHKSRNRVRSCPESVALGKGLRTSSSASKGPIPARGSWSTTGKSWRPCVASLRRWAPANGGGGAELACPRHCAGKNVPLMMDGLMHSAQAKQSGCGPPGKKPEVMRFRCRPFLVVLLTGCSSLRH
jgi:hypothetical protein